MKHLIHATWGGFRLVGARSDLDHKEVSSVRRKLDRVLSSPIEHPTYVHCFNGRLLVAEGKFNQASEYFIETVNGYDAGDLRTLYEKKYCEFYILLLAGDDACLEILRGTKPLPPKGLVSRLLPFPSEDVTRNLIKAFSASVKSPAAIQ